MSGTRLGRGRGGRLAVYGGCSVVAVLLIFLYRAATSEMARLRDLHVQCAHQQEALAAQLQVIFEYKVRLEKSLAEEKSSNAAVKQELQQRAKAEKSLRDKDSNEALQRFNSVQQSLKILQSEHQDLKEDCSKGQKQALHEREGLEETLTELRTQIMRAKDDKAKSLEHLKTRNIELEVKNEKLQKKYDELLKSTENDDSGKQHLQKEVFQLRRELEEAQRSCTGGGFQEKVATSSRASQFELPNLDKPKSEGGGGDKSSRQQQQQQQITPSSNDKLVPIVKAESSTRSSSAFTLNGVSPVKSAAKVKLPIGVVPIPIIIDTKNNPDENKEVKVDNNKQGDKANQADGKERGKLENSNLEVPPKLPVNKQHLAEQILNRVVDNDNWFNHVKPMKGVQEIGDDPNHFGKIRGFDDSARHGEAPDETYDNDYYKEGGQKNNDLHIEEEDEGEDEDDKLE